MGIRDRGKMREEEGREGKGRVGEGEVVGMKSWEISKRKRGTELPREGYGIMVSRMP